MQAGNLVVSDVQAFTSRVLVNGVQRAHESWSISRELSGDLPTQIVAGSGITQATGSIVWAEGTGVQQGGNNPWNRVEGWLPSRGDRVVIWAGDSVTEWVQFTGLVDKTTGSIGGSIQSTIIDDYDKLSATVTHEALLRIMPPYVNNAPYRGVGLVSTYYVDLAMRRAGFYCTPVQEPNSVVFAPCQGGLYPHSGTLTRATGFDSSVDTAVNNPAPWGFSVSNFYAEYWPRYVEPATTPVQLTVMVAPDHTGSFKFWVTYGSRTLELFVGSNRRVVVSSGGTSLTESCRLTPAQMDGATVVTLLVKGGVVTLGNDMGARATGTASLGSAGMDIVFVSGDVNARVAGFMVNHPTLAYMELRPLTFIPSAVMDMSETQLMGTMGAGRAIDNERADDLLTEISQATLTGMWIDEHGVLRWVPSLALRQRDAMYSVTTLNDILSLDWEDSLLGARSKIIATCKKPSISTSRRCSVVLYEGSGASMESQDVLEDIVGPGSDEAWIMPDETMTVLNPLAWSNYNVGYGTFGGVFYSSSGETISAAGLTTTITMEKLGVTQYKFTHAAGTFPADVSANLATSPTDPALWGRNRDKPLPVLRGFAKVQWSDYEISPETPGGVGPELVHDGGIWLAPSILANAAAFLAAQTAQPRPTITGLEVTYDPRRQLGDSIVVEARDLMGVSLKAVIVGIDNDASTSGYTQTLAVRIVSVTTRYTTYQAYNDALPDTQLTYQQWSQLAPTTQTYSAFNAA